jgi:hypothetical protein
VTISVWTPRVWGAPRAGGGDGEEPTPPSDGVTFLVPGSDIFPSVGLDALFYARRGLVGGTLARCWVAFTVGEQQYVLDLAHGGSAAHPVLWVPALAAAMRIQCNLGMASVTAEEVADAIIAALAGEDITATAEVSDDGRWAVTIADASDLVLPDPVDMTDTSLRGMWGMQRDDWGTGAEGQDLNADGGTGGTGSIHLGQIGTAGRIIGLYMWTATGAPMVVRLAASSGPAYSASPGVMTILGEGSETLQGFGTVVLDVVEASGFGATDEIWAHYRSDSGGGAGIRYRGFGQTPEGRGQQGANQVLVWDTDADASASTAFGGSYTPIVAATFNIYTAIGVIYEIPDGAGNYYADGSLTMRIGDQNPDPEHGTQFLAGPVFLNGETTHHRFRWIEDTNLEITEVWRTVSAIGADEDSRVAFYGPWADLDFPSTTPAPLLSDVGRMSITAAGANQYVLPTPIPAGSETLGTGVVISLGFNYIRNGGDPTTYTLPVYLSVAGDNAWLDCWEDDRGTWHDDIPGASGRGYSAGVSEYRTRTSAGNNNMPTSWGATYVNPFGTDASDDSPAAIAPDWIIVTRAGIAVAA